jgi:hypothetical protein
MLSPPISIFLLLSPSFAAADIKGNLVLFQKGEIMRSMPCRWEEGDDSKVAASPSRPLRFVRPGCLLVHQGSCLALEGPLVPAFLLSDDQLALLGEVVLGDLEVEGGGAFPDAAGDVVVGAVAGAEPTAVVAGLADGDTTQVGADACCGRVSGWLHARARAPEGRRDVPSMTSHLASLTRSSSAWGSRREATLTLLASSISPWVRWRMKTGLPRHLMMTCERSQYDPFASLALVGGRIRRHARSCPQG